MRKKFILILVALIIVVGGLLFYKKYNSIIIEKKTYDYLYTYNYMNEDVKDIKIKHYFINKILSYDEWQIRVTFKKEPNVVFAFTYKNKKIIPRTIDDASLSKEQIIEYEKKFENGYYKIDAKKFSDEYTKVSEDNVFVYKDIDEIIKIMKNGTGVVYLGFPECPWCQAYVQYLDETAKEVGIDKIYYFNILEDRKSNTKKYQEIVSLLSGNLQFDDEGNERIFVPNVSFHIEGKLIGNDYESSKDTHGLINPSEYWTDKEISSLKQKLKHYMEQIVSSKKMCTSDCNK